LANIEALAQEVRVVLEEAPTQQRRRSAVVHTVGGLVARPEFEAAPVAEGEQERFVDLADRGVGNRTRHGGAAECAGHRLRVARRIPAFQLDGQTDRGAVIQLRLADEVDFAFLNELEALVLNRGSVGGVGALDTASQREELVVAADADLDRVSCHGRSGHQSTGDQGGRSQ
jgi:hypothetical protein